MNETKGLFWILGVILLLAGLSIGAIWSPIADEKIVTVEKPIVVEKEIIKEVPVEVPTEDSAKIDTTLLDEAILDTIDEIDDEDSFLTCDGHLFDQDEVSFQRVKEWSVTLNDDDEYLVQYEGVWKFEDSSDERDCKDTRTYSVFYEDGEDPEVDY